MGNEKDRHSEDVETKGLLHGKYALVTGGANGIGRAIVEDLVREGAKVSFFDIDEEGIRALEQEFDPQIVKGYKVDITKREDLKRIFQTQDLENLDILVNCAGGGSPYSFENPNEEKWNQVMDRNFNGARFVTEYALPKMLKNPKGSIIFITSVHTAQAFSDQAPYDASKHALIGLMRVLAIDYGSRGIRVNAIAPGSIYHSGGTGLLPEDEAKKLGEKVPLRRLGEPEDIATIVSFIASEKANYITGAEIRVDGGLSVKNSLLS